VTTLNGRERHIWRTFPYFRLFIFVHFYDDEILMILIEASIGDWWIDSQHTPTDIKFYEFKSQKLVKILKFHSIASHKILEIFSALAAILDHKFL
jgi:hypothetical protein